jgi:hypothetical protein
MQRKVENVPEETAIFGVLFYDGWRNSQIKKDGNEIKIRPITSM